MAIEKHLKLTGISNVSWKDAITKTILEASKTIDYISSVTVLEQKAKIDGKYIRIMIDSGSNAVIGADGYAKTITGMARVKDQIYSANENSANIKESIAYTSDINKATVFITDADGRIGLQNLLMSTNGNDRIKYDIYEISINRINIAKEELDESND